MAKKKKPKFYVVWSGKRPGIYTTWAECSAQVTGFAGARYKSYESKVLAEQAYAGAPPKAGVKKPKTLAQKHGWRYAENAVEIPSLSVDAACSGNPGKMEYRIVDTETEAEIVARGPYVGGTNNIGEYLALVLAIIYQKKRNLNLPIYSDSRTALSWIHRKQVKTTLKPTAKNKEVFKQLDIAQEWVRNNTWTMRLLKWDTKNWGEIPADYGRK